MRIKVENDIAVVSYNSLDELIENTEKLPMYGYYYYNNRCNPCGKNLKDYIKNGNKRVAKEILTSKEVVNVEEYSSDNIYQTERKNYIYGQSINIPRYLNGLPNCYRLADQVERKAPIVDILLSFSFSWIVKNKYIKDWAIKIFSKIFALENKGVKTNVYITHFANHSKEYSKVDNEKYNYFSVITKVKSCNENLNVLKLSQIFSSEFYRVYLFANDAKYLTSDCHLGHPASIESSQFKTLIPESRDITLIYLDIKSDIDNAFKAVNV